MKVLTDIKFERNAFLVGSYWINENEMYVMFTSTTGNCCRILQQHSKCQVELIKTKFSSIVVHLGSSGILAIAWQRQILWNVNVT